jgi:membrane protease YdiL (CAAX protease family)
VAGARAEAQLQLSTAILFERRGSVFLLLGMLAWVIAGLVGALLVATVLGFSTLLLRQVLGFGFVPEPGLLAYVLAGSTAFQGTLLWGALRQGRRLGNGNRRVGLGVRPIRHVGQVALLCIVMIVCLLGFVLLAARIPTLREFAKSVTPDIMARLGEGGPFAVLVKVTLAMILAPLSEELFFRGWLWEALVRRGHAFATIACVTALPWLLLHGLDSPARIVFLIPAAVVFSLARQQGGSVLASLLVHVTNNTTAVLMQAIAVLVGA